jgi:hypothetical protein
VRAHVNGFCQSAAGRADGSFGGVVRASLSLDYFTTMLQNVDLGPHGEAIIYNTDGGAIMRQPFRLFGSAGCGRHPITQLASSVWLTVSLWGPTRS